MKVTKQTISLTLAALMLFTCTPGRALNLDKALTAWNLDQAALKGKVEAAVNKAILQAPRVNDTHSKEQTQLPVASEMLGSGPEGYLPCEEWEIWKKKVGNYGWIHRNEFAKYSYYERVKKSIAGFFKEEPPSENMKKQFELLKRKSIVMSFAEEDEMVWYHIYRHAYCDKDYGIVDNNIWDVCRTCYPEDNAPFSNLW